MWTAWVPGRVEMPAAWSRSMSALRGIGAVSGSTEVTKACQAWPPSPKRGMRRPAKPLQPVAVALGLALALGDEAVEFAELDQTDGALQVGHAIVEAEQVELGQQIGPGSGMALLLRDRCAVIAHPRHRLGKFGIVGGDHSALARGHRLARMEGESRRIAETAGGRAAESCAGGAGRVLDDPHVRRQHGADRVHVNAQAEQVDAITARVRSVTRRATSAGSRL
jgi:hypothetical protein